MKHHGGPPIVQPYSGGSKTPVADKKNKRVALLFAVSRQHEGQVLRGITDYASEHGKWTFDRNPENFAASISSLIGWSGDGIVAPLRTRREVDIAGTFGVPVVNTSGAIRQSGFPCVMVDQEEVGRLAAEHLLERGFKRFGFFGQKGAWYSKQRQAGFARRIEEAGGTYAVLEGPFSFKKEYWIGWENQLQPWLESLKPPVGVMAVHDFRARMVLDACLRIGLDVPRDIAIVGVDNDEVACEFSDIPISSVARDSWREGYEAAALLDRLMQGKKTASCVLVPANGVVARHSTEVDMIENPTMAEAVRFIKDNLDKNFGVETLAAHLEVSPRYLYYQFQQCLKCTPHEYISRARVTLAKKLLVDPKRLQLQEISRACGFSEPRRFRVVFRRLTGVSPSEYRRSQVTR